MLGKLYKTLGVFILFAFSACTDLSENLYDRITTENFFRQRKILSVLVWFHMTIVSGQFSVVKGLFSVCRNLRRIR